MSLYLRFSTCLDAVWKVLRSDGSCDYFALATLAKNRSKADIAFASWATGLRAIQADRVWRMLSFGEVDLWDRVQGVHTEVRRWPRPPPLHTISRHCAKINKCFVLLRWTMSVHDLGVSLSSQRPL